MKSISSRENDLFIRADRAWDDGKSKLAFRLFLKAAKAGDRSSELNVGYFYDAGIGVKRNREKALFWYRRAYKRGDASAASNIGTIWRDGGQLIRALGWFLRAVELGDGDANLEIAKIYLYQRKTHHRAIPYLNRTIKSKCATEDSREQANRLLKSLMQSPLRKTTPSKRLKKTKRRAGFSR